MNDILGVLPFAMLAVGAAVMLLFDRLVPADERAGAWLAATIALGAAAASMLAGTGDDALGGLLRRDGATVFLTSVMCAGAATVFALGAGVAGPTERRAPVAAMLVATAGATLMIAAADLVLLFVAVEMVFMSLFALIAGTPSVRMPSASRSFFLLGGSASALLAVGVGLAWSDGGSFAIGALSSVSSPAGQAGLALVLVGLACFAGLVPFHLWLPPALAGASSSSAAIIAVVPRVAAFAALMRCAGAISANGGSAIDWRACVAVLAAASLAVGSVSALTESSLRRIVAHLAIAYGGQIAIAAAAGVGASAAIGLALMTYVVVVIGLLGAIALVPGGDPQIDDLRGLARRRPLLVVALGILALGMAGLPPTIAFFARLAVFEAAVGAQLAWLVIFAGIASVLTAAAGFRIVFACFEAGEERMSSGRVATGVVAIAALVALAGGIAPAPLLQLAQGVRF